MTEYSPTDLAAQLKSGLLSFPVTHFTDDLEFDEAGYRKHLAWLADHPVAGLFAAGGTGEGFSLTFEETERVVRAAVDQASLPGPLTPQLASSHPARPSPATPLATRSGVSGSTRTSWGPTRCRCAPLGVQTNLGRSSNQAASRTLETAPRRRTITWDDAGLPLQPRRRARAQRVKAGELRPQPT